MIHININPDMFNLGTFNVTWHGFLTFVAVALAMVLVVRWARRERIHPDIVYNTATWAILGGIVGARAVHVIDQWDFYSQNPGQIVAIWRGGIALYGAILGGFVGGAIFAAIRNYPVGRLADVTAPAMLISQFVGRIGDIINGEHCASATGMPWGFVYDHPASPANLCATPASTAVHPVIAMEMLWDMAVFGIIWNLRGRLRPHGSLFLFYLALYSLGRLFITFFREDKVWFLELQQAQLIAIVVLALAIPVLVYKLQWVKREPEAAPPTGGERRKRGR